MKVSQSFDLFIDLAVSTEEQFFALSRTLVLAVVARGAQLAIIKRLPTTDHIFLHTEALSFIVDKLALLEQTKRKELRNSALCFFKALANWLIGIDGKGALAMYVLIPTACLIRFLGADEIWFVVPSAKIDSRNLSNPRSSKFL